MCLLLISMTACSPVIWKHDSHNDQYQFSVDREECKTMAEKRSSLREDNRQYRTIGEQLGAEIGKAIAQGVAMILLFKGCMKGKGYYAVDKENSPN
jgi:hypothetical protein